MNDQETIDQALEQLRRRAYALRAAGLASAHELARDIDQVHPQWLERYTVPQRPAPLFSWDDHVRTLPPNAVISISTTEEPTCR